MPIVPVRGHPRRNPVNPGKHKVRPFFRKIRYTNKNGEMRPFTPKKEKYVDVDVPKKIIKYMSTLEPKVEREYRFLTQIGYDDFDKVVYAYGDKKTMIGIRDYLVQVAPQYIQYEGISSGTHKIYTYNHFGRKIRLTVPVDSNDNGFMTIDYNNPNLFKRDKNYMHTVFGDRLTESHGEHRGKGVDIDIKKNFGREIGE